LVCFTNFRSLIVAVNNWLCEWVYSLFDTCGSPIENSLCKVVRNLESWVPSLKVTKVSNRFNKGILRNRSMKVNTYNSSSLQRTQRIFYLLALICQFSCGWKRLVNDSWSVI